MTCVTWQSYCCMYNLPCKDFPKKRALKKADIGLCSSISRDKFKVGWITFLLYRWVDLFKFCQKYFLSWISRLVNLFFGFFNKTLLVLQDFTKMWKSASLRKRLIEFVAQVKSSNFNWILYCVIRLENIILCKKIVLRNI